jgi:DNA-binding response OmpR family regulator
VSPLPAEGLERRVLILAPLGKDAELMESMLGKEAVTCIACDDLDCVARELERGAAAILLTEEALAARDGKLAAMITRQPPWSDLPVLILTRRGADSPTGEPGGGHAGQL